MSEEIYWLGPGKLKVKTGKPFIKPNQVLSEEVLKMIGEKRIQQFFKQKLISNLTPALARQQVGRNEQEAVKKSQAEIANLKITISTLTGANVALDKRNVELIEAKTKDSPAFKKLETAYQTKCDQNKRLQTEIDDLISANKTLKKHNDKLHKWNGKLEKKLNKKGISFNEEDREKEGDELNQNDGDPLVNLKKPAGPG